MRQHIRKAIYLVVVNSVFSFQALAGSYEDFFQAIKQDDARTLQALLQRGFDANVPDPSGARGLFIALREPSLKAARVLADWEKTDVDVRNKDDETPLMMAALKGHRDLAARLVERGADVNKTGWAPLHYAATGGHVAVMRLLLENHAYIDAESPNGTTPLMMAARYGSESSVKLLLEEGADPTLKNEQGLTALDFAGLGNRKESAVLIQAFVRAWVARNGVR